MTEQQNELLLQVPPLRPPKTAGLHCEPTVLPAVACLFQPNWLMMALPASESFCSLVPFFFLRRVAEK